MTPPRTFIGALALTAVLIACSHPPVKPKANPASIALKADLKVAEFKVVDARDRPEAVKAAEAARTAVLAALNGYLEAAFIQPKKWTAADNNAALAGQFTAEAQPNLGPNLSALGLAELAPEVGSAKIIQQDATKVSEFVDDDLSVPLALVTLTFKEKAERKSGGKIDISQTGTFWLQLENGAYKISSYEVESKADTVSKKAAWGPGLGPGPPGKTGGPA